MWIGARDNDIGAMHNFCPRRFPTKSNPFLSLTAQPRKFSFKNLGSLPSSHSSRSSSRPNTMIPLHSWLSVILTIFDLRNTLTSARPPPSPVHLIFKKATTENGLVPYVEGHCNSVQIDTPRLFQIGDLRG